MPASIYSEKLVEPNDMMLTYDLADTKNYLDIIAEFIENEYCEFKSEWKFYNQKSGWILKMFTKKRNVLFVVPCNRYFLITFIFGDKASDLIFNSKLPELIKTDLFGAKKYAEGRTIQIEVKTAYDLNNILELIRIKLTN